MGTFTLTAGDIGGVYQGYVPGIAGAISAEPLVGEVLSFLLTGPGAGADFVGFVGFKPADFIASLTVNGNSWAVAPGEYDPDSGSTMFALTPSGGEFVNTVAYTVNITAAAPPATFNVAMRNPGPAFNVAFSDGGAVDTVYIGGTPRAQRYLGTRTDADLYLGAKVLFP